MACRFEDLKVGKCTVMSQAVLEKDDQFEQSF
jgi:hypothetical protein